MTLYGQFNLRRAMRMRRGNLLRRNVRDTKCGAFVIVEWLREMRTTRVDKEIDGSMDDPWRWAHATPRSTVANYSPMRRRRRTLATTDFERRRRRSVSP